MLRAPKPRAGEVGPKHAVRVVHFCASTLELGVAEAGSSRAGEALTIRGGGSGDRRMAVLRVTATRPPTWTYSTWVREAKPIVQSKSPENTRFGFGKISVIFTRRVEDSSSKRLA